MSSYKQIAMCFYFDYVCVMSHYADYLFISSKDKTAYADVAAIGTLSERIEKETLLSHWNAE